MFTKFLDYAKENKSVVIGASVGLVVASGLAFAGWVGAFKKMKIEEKKFEGGIFYYTDYKGHVRHIQNAFRDVMDNHK